MNNIINNIRTIFFAAIFVYLILAPFFFHPDLKTIFYLSQFLKQGVLNIYEFISENQDKAFLGPFVYPPAAYFVLGIIFIPINFLAGTEFIRWLAMGNDFVGIRYIFRYLFIMKFPFILLNLATGFILTQLVKEEREKVKILLFWFFNPVNLYVIAMMGQIDIIPVFLTVLAVYWSGKRPIWSAISLGLGAAIKSYPILFLPFLVVIVGKDFKSRIKIFLAGFIPYIMIIFPFLGTQSFFEDTFVSGLSQRLFQLGLSIGFGEHILLVPAILILLFIYCYFYDSGKQQKLFAYFLAVILVILSASHFHPQWGLWAIPFLAIGIVKYKILFPSFIFIFAWVAKVLLFDDKFLTFGLLSPIDSGVFFLPPPVSILTKFIDPLLLRNLFQTILFSASISIIYLVLTKRKYE